MSWQAYSPAVRRGNFGSTMSLCGTMPYTAVLIILYLAVCHAASIIVVSERVSAAVTLDAHLSTKRRN